MTVRLSAKTYQISPFSEIDFFIILKKSISEKGEIIFRKKNKS